VVRGDYSVNSDVDVLVITDKTKTPWDRTWISAKIKEEMRFDNLFELHVVTRKNMKSGSGNSLISTRSSKPKPYPLKGGTVL